MSKRLLLLALYVTICFAGSVSPASGQDPLPIYSFVGFIDTTPFRLEGVLPGGSFELALSVFTITSVCITDETHTCETFGENHLPVGTQLISTNPTVASVFSTSFSTSIELSSPGATTLQLLREDGVLASYELVVSPIPLYSFVGFIGSDESRLNGVSPGNVLDVPISAFSITSICITEDASNCESFGEDNIPADAQLVSTNPEVASVSQVFSGTSIVLNRPGSTTLELRQGGQVLASYILVVTPVPPGTICDSIDLGFDAVVDCSGKCVPSEEARQRFGDGICDDGSEGIDLSCIFIPALVFDDTFFRERFINARAFDGSLNEINPTDRNIDIFVSPFGGLRSIRQDQTLVSISINTDLFSSGRDGGDCSSEAICRAQFGTAPGFELCKATSGVCSFNATTQDGNGDPGTCAALCQGFGSKCVAALNNNPAGCTPMPNNTDTCETPRNSEICFCERR